MSQNWKAPLDTNKALATLLATDVSDTVEALRTMHAGASAPTTTVARMLWADETTGLWKIRNTANDGWDVIGPIGQDLSRQVVSLRWSNISATTTFQVYAATRAMKVEQVTLMSAIATTSDSTNNWTFMLRNHTQSLDLFSSVVGTDDVLGGVGGGELAVKTAYPLVANQNAVIAGLDVLEFTLSTTGSPTPLTGELVFQMELVEQ